MGNLYRDIKYGIRSLLRDKGFASTVLLTLAVCIAANAAIFAIVNSVVLRPLPVPNAREIVLTSNSYPKAGAPKTTESSVGDYYDRLQGVTALSPQALFNESDQAIEIGGIPQQIRGYAVTPSFFPLIEVSPLHGRAFTDAEGEIGNEHKVILSDGLWKTLYGGSLSAIGRELRIGGRPYTIVGIMPPGFNFVNPEVRFWIPLAFTAKEKTTHHNNNWHNIGRLKPGATISQAQAQVDAVNAANLDRFPQFKNLLINAGFHSVVEPLEDMIVGDIKPTLYLLWGGAIFVLLIGALNLANVALARFTVRRKEVATRLALGVSQSALLHQFIVENVLVSLAGGVAGLLLGFALLRSLTVIGFERFPRASEVHIDATVVLVALALSALVGVLLGALPLINVSKLNVSNVLHDASRTGTAGTGARRLRQVLVGAELGLSFVLLVGAGLLLTSFRNLLHVDPGFTADRVLTASTFAPSSRYADDKAVNALMRRALDSIRQTPGVVSAGATSAIPFGTSHSDSVILAEGYTMKPGESLISATRFDVTPGYFESMRIPLVRGRYFDDRDSETSKFAVIVDEKLAHHFWPDRDPIGRRLYEPNDPVDIMKIDAKTRFYTVVGVVHGIRTSDLAGSDNPVGTYYFPFTQDTSRMFTFAIKTNLDSSAMERTIRAQFAQIDPELPLFDMKTMQERTALSLSSRRTSMLLALGFGVVALFLSIVGIYGVLAYLVTQRRREIGIRIALGSTSMGVLNVVLRESLTLVVIGLATGFVGALAMQKTVATQVYGVQPLDPLVIGSVVVLLAAVAVVASAIPAQRAMRIDPVIVLNEQ